MKALKLVALVSVFTSSAFAQNPGFFVTAGAGMATQKVGDFVVYNPLASIPGSPLGEPLAALDKQSSVAFARFTLGYTFTQNWDFRFSYTAYDTGNVQMAFPLYPGIFFITGPDLYERHEMRYNSTAFTLLPTYTHVLSDKLRLRAGAGISYSQTSTHFEASYQSGATVPRPPARAYSYTEATESSIGYILLLGVDYLITEKLSVGISGNYTTMKTKVPNSPWANRSKSSVSINATGAEMALTWHW